MCAVLEDDVVELLGIGEAADDADGDLKVLLGVGGRLAELAGGDFDVLLGESVGDVEGGEAAGGEPGGIEPDAHGVLALAEDDDVADAGDALERVADVDVEVVGDEGLRERVVGRDEAGGEDEVGVGLGDGDAGVVDDGGQTALRGGDAVLHVDGGDVEVVAGLEGDGDGAGAVVGAGGAHVAHALDAVDGLLEDGGDGGLDVLGVGADVVAGDDDLRRREVGIERDRQGRDADGAGEHDEQRADGGEDWAANEEIYEQGATSRPARTGPGVERRRCGAGESGLRRSASKASGLAERLDRGAFLQELQAGDDDLVAGLETAERPGRCCRWCRPAVTATWWAMNPSPLGAAT